jgi:hypothetical protein
LGYFVLEDLSRDVFSGPRLFQKATRLRYFVARRMSGTDNPPPDVLTILRLYFHGDVKSLGGAKRSISSSLFAIQPRELICTLFMKKGSPKAS